MSSDWYTKIMSDPFRAPDSLPPTPATNPPPPANNLPPAPTLPENPPASYLKPNIHHALHEGPPPKKHDEPKPDEHPDEKDKDSHKIDLIKTTHTNTYKKEDPPLFNLQMTNPVTYLKRWWTRVMANEGIIFSFRIRPLTAVLLILALGAAGGTSFSLVRVFFPTSSPIFHRGVIYQGLLQETSAGDYYLVLPDNSLYRLNSKTNLSGLANHRVMVKGNLTKEPNVIDVKEITQFN